MRFILCRFISATEDLRGELPVFPSKLLLLIHVTSMAEIPWTRNSVTGRGTGLLGALHWLSYAFIVFCIFVLSQYFWLSPQALRRTSLCVVQYSKNINFKLLMIKLLHGCYSDMFRINGFIQLFILLVYSLKMVTGKCNGNISIFL